MEGVAVAGRAGTIGRPSQPSPPRAIVRSSVLGHIMSANVNAAPSNDGFIATSS